MLNENYGRELRARRLALKLSEHELAKKAKVARMTLRKIERGENVTVKNIQRVEEALRAYAEEIAPAIERERELASAVA